MLQFLVDGCIRPPYLYAIATLGPPHSQAPTRLESG